MRLPYENAIKGARADFSIKQILTNSFCMRFTASATCAVCLVALGGCGTRPVPQSEGHIQPPARPEASIPQPVRAVPLPPPPQAR